MYKNKKNIYRKIMAHNVRAIYNRMNKMLSTIPPNKDIHLSEDGEHQDTIFNVMSIEEEWIIDPDVRDDITLLNLKPKK